jgi:hypothetical protein
MSFICMLTNPFERAKLFTNPVLRKVGGRERVSICYPNAVFLLATVYNIYQWIFEHVSLYASGERTASLGDQYPTGVATSGTSMMI